MDLRYIMARELLLGIQEAQPKLDLLYTNSMNSNMLRFIGRSGFVLVPNSTVDKIIHDEYLKTVFDPVGAPGVIPDTGFIGTFHLEPKRKIDKDIYIPVYAPGVCDIEFNSSHDYNVFLTPFPFSNVTEPENPFMALISK